MESLKRLQYIYKIINDCYPGFSFSSAPTLFINYSQISDLSNIQIHNITYYSSLKNQLRIAKEIGLRTQTSIKEQFEIVIISVPKSKEEAFGLIAMAHQQIKPGGLLVIEGSNRSGINSIIKTLSKLIDIEHTASKAHGKIALIQAYPEHINTFSKWMKFNSPSINKDGFFSMPGLFSYKKVDTASNFLTSVFSDKLFGDIIDLGAGWGFLSLELLKKCSKVKSITLLDYDQRALDCAKLNIKNSKAIFKRMDVNEVTELMFKFDTVICNPPFHSSEGTNIDLGKRFIKVAHDSLKNSGSLLLVANIQLPYEKLIAALFDSFEIKAKNKYFKIILAKGPKRYYDNSFVKL